MDRLQREFEAIESESSGETKRKYQDMVTENRLAEQDKIFQEAEARKEKVEANFWHNHYDYILKRCNDLGINTLKKYV